jgi:hypothetical protein
MMISAPYKEDMDLLLNQHKRHFQDDSEYSQSLPRCRRRISDSDIDASIQGCAREFNQSLWLDESISSSRAKRRIDDISDDLWDIDDSDEIRQSTARCRLSPLEQDEFHGENIDQNNIGEPSISRGEAAVSDEDAEGFFALNKSKKRYPSQADYMVDEIIRKHRKGVYRDSYIPNDFDSKIPTSIGPHPTTDHALSMMVPSHISAALNETSELRSRRGSTVPRQPQSTRSIKASSVSHRECFEGDSESESEETVGTRAVSRWTYGELDGDMEIDYFAGDDLTDIDDDVEDLGTY